jgi:hypothetical protein
MLSHIFTLAEGGWRSGPKRIVRAERVNLGASWGGSLLVPGAGGRQEGFAEATWHGFPKGLARFA